MTTRFPSVHECVLLHKEFIILVSHTCILVDKLNAFHVLEDAIEEHIHHQYSHEMAQKSDIVGTHWVPYGVLLKAENKTEDLILPATHSGHR